MTRQILVATDFSDEAEGALRLAIDHARASAARLHILHVLAHGDLEVTRLLADAKALAGTDVTVTVATVTGEAAGAILRYARDHAIDLIVIGTHGRSGFSRALLGSVADRVLRGAPCAVLVVPSRALTRASRADTAGEIDPEEDVAAARPCLVCAQSSLDLVCAPCRARIRGEALERKQREERAGRA